MPGRVYESMPSMGLPFYGYHRDQTSPSSLVSSIPSDSILLLEKKFLQVSPLFF